MAANMSSAAESAPRFSILVPVYNVRQYIEESLGSIAAQTYCDYEVVLVDDGSTDGSGEFCEEFACQNDNVTVVHQENSGLLMARRVALSHASGQYIVTFDSDDALRPDALELLSNTIDAWAPDIVVFDYARSKDFEVYGPRRYGFDAEFYEGAEYERLKLKTCDGKHNNLWSKCYRRDIADMRADYSVHKGLTHAEDLIQLLPIVDAGRSFAYVDEALYYYRPNPTSSTGTYKAKQLDNLVVALRSLLEYSESWGSECVESARKGSLLQISYLLHILIMSNMSSAEKRLELQRIRLCAKELGLFDEWLGTMRLDKRLEMQALSKGHMAALNCLVKLLMTGKRAYDKQVFR